MPQFVPEFLVRATEPTPEHGRDPQDRPVEELVDRGCVYLDKPTGPTTHQAAAWLRDVLGASKVAHAGTLDPNVSGVVPCALGRAVKLTQVFRGVDKRYVAVLQLHEPVQRDRVMEALEGFTGRVEQVPPARSAVKRRKRKRTVHELQVIETSPEDAPRRVLFEVACEAGFYVRRLCTDVGKRLGVGAHMEALRRTGVGHVDEADTVTLHDVKDAHDHWRQTGEEDWLREVVRPIEDLVPHVPRVVVRSGAVDAVCHGAPLHAPGLLEVQAGIEPGDRVLLVTGRGETIALGEAAMDAVTAVDAEQGVVARPDSVLMATGTYPRNW